MQALTVLCLTLVGVSHPVYGATVGFQPAVTWPVGTAPLAAAAADFNCDGKTDLAIANNGDAGAGDDGSVSVLLGNGDGTFRPAHTFAVGKNPFATGAADFYGDGKADLALINLSGLGILLSNGDGTFGLVTYFPTAPGPASLAVSDLDGDNSLDLVVAASSLSVLLGPGFRRTRRDARAKQERLAVFTPA